jgi:hypothetical protein
MWKDGTWTGNLHIFDPEERLFEIVKDLELAKSNSDAKRLIESGGITLNGAQVKDPNTLPAALSDPIILWKSRRFSVMLCKRTGDPLWDDPDSWINQIEIVVPNEQTKTNQAEE